MTLCPYCRQPMSGMAALPSMRPRWMRIYNAVLEAGHHGIASEDLLVRMYSEKEWPTPGGFAVLRVCIHGINRLLAPYRQRIVNPHRGLYRLIFVKGARDEEEVHPEANH